MDYRTEAHTFTATADFTPLPKLSLNMTATYMTGRGNITDLKFGHYVTDDLKLGYDTSPINPNQPQLYDTYYINAVDNYSNLDFNEFDFTAGMSYRVTDRIGLGVNYYYTDFEDEEAYVYGEQDVTVQSLMGYMTYSF
jgi:hypothetical protein